MQLSFALLYLILVFCCYVVQAMEDPLFRRKPQFPMMLKAYSTTDIPKFAAAPLTPRTEETQQLVREDKDTWTQMLGLYYSNEFKESIEKLESLRVKKSEYFHSYDTVTELPYFYNHGLLHLALFRRTRQITHLINAKMSIDMAISRCRHFYPAYLAKAQVLVYERSWSEARKQLDQLVGLLEIQRFADMNILKFDTNVYKGTIFVADILADLGAIEFRMGVIQETCESRFTVANQILDRCERHADIPRSTSPSLLREFFQRKRVDYQKIRSRQVHGIDQSKTAGNQLISLSLDLILVPDSNDVGIVEWQNIGDHLMFRALEGRRHKRLSSGPKAIVIDRFHRQRAATRAAREGRAEQIPLAPPNVSRFIPPAPDFPIEPAAPLPESEESMHHHDKPKSDRWTTLTKNRFKSMIFRKKRS